MGLSIIERGIFKSYILVLSLKLKNKTFPLAIYLYRTFAEKFISAKSSKILVD